VPGTAPPGGFGGQVTQDLLLYKHLGYAEGSTAWTGPQRVGTGWNAASMILGPHRTIYAVKPDGEVLWFEHLGQADGSFQWAGPNPVKSGWHIGGINPPADRFLGVFCDSGNEQHYLKPGSRPAIIYAVRADGTLLWFRHDGAADGTPRWANGGEPKVVGTGWVAGHKRVFSGRDGVIYLIGDDGKLRWYRHKGVLEGTFDWEGPQEIGDDWGNFTTVFSIGGGYIYAVDGAGDLWWQHHEGHAQGTRKWGARKKVGNGWSANFSVMVNTVFLKPTILR
jgi:hypothetical protein